MCSLKKIMQDDFESINWQVLWMNVSCMRDIQILVTSSLLFYWSVLQQEQWFPWIRYCYSYHIYSLVSWIQLVYSLNLSPALECIVFSLWQLIWIVDVLFYYVWSSFTVFPQTVSKNLNQERPFTLRLL